MQQLMAPKLLTMVFLILDCISFLSHECYVNLVVEVKRQVGKTIGLVSSANGSVVIKQKSNVCWT